MFFGTKDTIVVIPENVNFDDLVTLPLVFSFRSSRGTSLRMFLMVPTRVNFFPRKKTSQLFTNKEIVSRDVSASSVVRLHEILDYAGTKILFYSTLYGNMWCT